MKIDVITAFEEMVDQTLSHSIVGRARKAGIIKVGTLSPRQFTTDKHQTIDDRPYGGRLAHGGSGRPSECLPSHRLRGLPPGGLPDRLHQHPHQHHPSAHYGQGHAQQGLLHPQHLLPGAHPHRLGPGWYRAPVLRQHAPPPVLLSGLHRLGPVHLVQQADQGALIRRAQPRKL